MAIVGYTLDADALQIRDTVVENENSAERVGKWCVECTAYIEGPASLATLAATVRAETVSLANSAKRLGKWCQDAIAFVGIRQGKEDLFFDLTSRADLIYKETEERRNERRLGAWFVDFLLYVDYSGDVDTSTFWMLTYTITGTSTTQRQTYLPFNGYELNIDWGDGTVETVGASQDMPRSGWPHIYPGPGTYQITVQGLRENGFLKSINYASSPSTTSSPIQLIRVDQIGTSINPQRLCFSNCYNFIGFAEQDNFSELLGNCYQMLNLFNGCRSLVDLPDDLFSGISDSSNTELTNAFNGCRQLRSLPTGFFSRVSSVESGESMFYGCFNLVSIGNVFSGIITPYGGLELGSMFYSCSSLESIDKDFFVFARNCVNLNSVFNNCRRLQTVPREIFKGLSSCITMASAFYQSGLMAIPQGLLSDCTSLQRVSSMFQGTQISAIPGDIFVNLPISDVRACFSECSNVTSIPDTLFTNKTTLTNIDTTFSYTGITSIPVNLFEGCTNITSATTTFSGTKIQSIPEGLFRDCPNIRIFSGTFSACYLLTSIPDDFFSYSADKITNISLCFQGTSLSEMPGGQLTEGMVNCTSVASVFYGCARMQRAVGDFFNNMPNITTLYQVFANCTGLTELGENIFQNCTKVTTIEYLFNNFRLSDSPDTPVIIPGNLLQNCTQIVNAAFLFGSCDMGKVSIDFNAFFAPFGATINSVRAIFQNARFSELPPADSFRTLNPNLITSFFANTVWDGGNANTNIIPDYFSHMDRISACAGVFSYAFSGSRMDVSQIVFPKQINDFTQTFWNMTSAVSAPPTGPDGYELWERAGKEGYPVSIVGTQCFRGSNVTGFAQIPAAWK